MPNKDIETIEEYLEHGEWGIAFEVLRSAIESDKTTISHNDYIQIKEIGKYMGMDKDLREVFEV
ncbi:MAG TPA: hypothetical protein DD791_10480 [Syntrophomonas sp.]|nr:hypothetical protein [Syntrophomonas sp.]